MGAAILVRHIVREAEDLLLVTGVPLHRELDSQWRPAAFERALGDDRDDPIVDRLLGLVQVFDEFANPALVLEGFLTTAISLVCKRDQESGVQKRELAEPAGKNVVLKFDRRKDRRVWLERHLRAGLVRISYYGKRRHWRTAPVLLEMHVALAPDLHLEPLAHGVDGAHSFPVVFCIIFFFFFF